MPSEVGLPSQQDANLLSNMLNGVPIGNIEDFGTVGNIEDFGSYQQQVSKPTQLNIMPNATQKTPSSKIVNVEEPPVDYGKTTGRKVADFFAPFSGELVGANYGARAGAALGAFSPPLAPALTLGGMVVGAGIGHLGGDLAVKKIADGTISEDSLNESFSDAGESAAWTAGGGLFLKGIGTISAQVVKSQGLEGLSAKQAWQKLVNKSGGTLQPSWVTDNTLDKLAANLSVVGVGGKGAIEQNLLKVQLAANNELNALIEAGRSGKMTTADFGNNFSRILSDTDALMKQQYGQFADKLNDVGVQVNLNGVKEAAESVVKSHTDSLSGIGDSVYTFAKDILSRDLSKTSVVDLKDKIGELSALRRHMSLEGGTPPKAYKELQKIDDALQEAFDKAVTSTGNRELIEEYQSVNKMYSEGRKVLMNKTVAKLWDDPARLSGVLYGNSSQLEVQDVMKALYYRKSIDPKFNTKEALYNLRSDYLEHMVKSGDERTLGDIASFERKLKNPEAAKTFNAVMGGDASEYKRRVGVVLGLAKQVTENMPKGGVGSLVVSGKQAEALSGSTNPLMYLFAAVPKAASWFAIDASRTNRLLGLTKQLESAPQSGFKRSVLLGKAAELVHEFYKDTGTPFEQDTEVVSGQQANPMFNKQQSTLQ